MNRKFFIAFTLSEEADVKARVISEDLNRKFAIKNHYGDNEKYPPHITLKLPFGGLARQREELVDYLERFVLDRAEVPVKLSGFGHFNIGTAYWDVIQFSDDLTNLQRELCNGLENNFRWISFNPIEPNGIPHITVADQDIQGRFGSIYQYLLHEYPGYLVERLRTIALFEKTANAHSWNSVATFALKPSF